MTLGNLSFQREEIEVERHLLLKKPLASYFSSVGAFLFFLLNNGFSTGNEEEKSKDKEFGHGFSLKEEALVLAISV